MGILEDVPFDTRRPEAIELLERLSANFGDKDAVILIAATSGIIQASVNWDGPMLEVWPRLLMKAAGCGRLHELVTNLSLAVPEERLLQRLLSQARPPGNVPGPILDPFETSLLWDDEPIIDRSQLRAHLKRMMSPNGRRALLVVGSDKPGKTHTRRFLSYLAENGHAGDVLTIDNSLRAGLPIDVPELAQWISTTMLGTDAPRFDAFAQAEAQVTPFIGWLTNETVMKLPTPLWLVFDGFTVTTSTSAATQLVADIARRAADRQLGQLRVAVLGFDGALVLTDGALCDSLGHPSDDDVRTFFARTALSVRGEVLNEEVAEELFRAFVALGGPIDQRPLQELGPAALAFAFHAYGRAS